jgi:branched-chain amino acid transport system substrate-binding protein
MRRSHKAMLAGAVCATTLAAAACGSSGGSSGAGSGNSPGSGTIVIGSVDTLSGQVTFPEASQAAKAVFAKVNSTGGIDGKKIDYIALDDKGDPATAAQDARLLITQDNAVALDGSASLLDCEVNAAFYAQSGISSVPGVGVDPACFASAVIAPANVGPYLGTQAILQYGSQQLHLNKICAFFSIIAGTGPAYAHAVAGWSAATGQKLALDDTSVPPTTADFTPYLLHARRLGCDGIFVNAIEPAAVTLAKDMVAQKMMVPLLTLSSTYTAQAASAIGSVSFPLYSASEFAPYTDPNAPENADWRSLMTAGHIPLTSFSQGGYLAATYLVQVLRHIHGAITRQSVTAALHSMSPVSNAMTGTPWVFGTVSAHNPNHAIKVVVLKDGAWSIAQPGWVIVAGR